MRNLKEYPITMDEVRGAVELALMRVDDDDNVGSIDALVLSRLLEILTNGNAIQAEDFE